MSKTDVFDILGISLLALFAFDLRPSLALLVFAVAFLAASRKATR